MDVPFKVKSFKMASPLAVQRLFSTQKKFYVDPPSMAYGRSKYDKKLVSDLSFLSYSQKTKKSDKNRLFSLIFEVQKLSISRDW